MTETESIRLVEYYIKLFETSPDDAVDQWFEYSEDKMRKKDIQALDNFIRDYRPLSTHHRFAVNLLRSTYRVAHLLEEWQTLVSYEKRILENDNMDARRILRGLIK